jgi:hypothetical protein
VSKSENSNDRSRALPPPGRASGQPKPPPPTFGDPTPPQGQVLGRVPVAKVPASEVHRLHVDPPQPATASPPRPRREAPARPPTANPNAAPVLTKVPPPFTVRVSQFLWVMSLLAGAIAIVYLFVIREDEVPLIADMVRGVAEGRSDETYTAAADIVYWSIFGAAVALLLVQIVLLVSFSNRKPNARWWQLATVIGQILVFLLSFEFLGDGQHGPVLRQVLVAQWGLALLALLMSSFRNALQWTARRHDVRRAGGGEGPEF